MATVIDALVVTLGLDPKKFNDGHKKARDDLDKTKKQTQQTAKEMERYGKQAAAFFTQIRNEALTLFAVLAIGGGLKSFITGTIHSAAQLGFMADNLGMSTKRLSAWQMAAERAGGSAQGITSQLQESQQAAAQFHMGMSGEGAQWFFRMGGNANDLKDGNSYLLARARIIHELYKSDPGRAALMAQRMGISPDTFNLLKQGPAAVLALVEAQKKNAVVTEAQSKKALALENRWRDIRDEFRATSIEILFTLMPVFNDLTRAIKEGADWVAKHRQDIKEWVDAAVNGLTEFAHEADGAAQSVGGWKTVLEALLALKVLQFTRSLFGLAGALGKVGAALNVAVAAGTVGWTIGNYLRKHLSSGTQDKIGQLIAETLDVFGNKTAHDTLVTKNMGGREQYLMRQLSLGGYSPEQSAGIVGSLIQESRLDPTAVNKTSGAGGIGQWLGDRRKQYMKMFNTVPEMDSFENQVSFLIWEMNHTQKRAGDAIRHARTSDQAAVLHRSLYERPGRAEANDRARIANAREVLSYWHPVGTRVVNGNTVTSETHIGKVEVHTQATDAHGMARDMHRALKEQHLVAQSNGGLN